MPQMVLVSHRTEAVIEGKPVSMRSFMLRPKIGTMTGISFCGGASMGSPDTGSAPFHCGSEEGFTSIECREECSDQCCPPVPSYLLSIGTSRPGGLV